MCLISPGPEKVAGAKLNMQLSEKWKESTATVSDLIQDPTPSVPI